MRTRGYIRESTAKQGERYGPDSQRITIERACRELGLEAPDHWYTDLISGTGRVVRDDFQRTLAAARAGEFDLLVCYDTSRFARNTRDALNFEAAFTAAGVRVYYAVERYWADDEDLALPKEIQHAINADYSRKLRRRIRDGFAAKFAKHGLPGGRLPWGYRWGPDAKSIEIDEAVAATRRLIFELYGTGEYSSRSLADELNRRGLRIDGRPFSGWSAFEILKNPIALGTTHRGDERREGVAPALIEVELYDRCQRILAERRSWAGAARRKNTFVFSSRARHASCGRALWGWQKPVRGRVERRLVHSVPRCDVPFQRNEELLERIFATWLRTFRFDARHRARLDAFLHEGEARVDDVDAVRRRAEQRLERARQLYLLGDLDEVAFTRERRAARDIIDAPRPHELTAEAAIALRDLADAWPKASIEARRAFVEELVTEIRFDGDDIELVIRPELRRMVAAIASPEISLTIAQERDARGRWTQKVEEVTVGESCGRCWNHVSTSVLRVDSATAVLRRTWVAAA